MDRTATDVDAVPVADVAIDAAPVVATLTDAATLAVVAPMDVDAV